MMDAATLLAQAGLAAFLGGWIGVGALDNWRHPKMNEEAVGMVMRFDRMQQEYPEDYALVAYRRVDDPRVIRAAFTLIVLWETIAALLLLAGAAALLAALLGLMPADAARALGMLGALAFTANWAAFLIGGNYFCYWYSHYPGQSTHFQLVLWGTAAMIFLALPA